MIIKIGGIYLQEWKYFGPNSPQSREGWYRDNPIHERFDGAIYLYKETEVDVWTVSFFDDLEYLYPLFGEREFIGVIDKLKQKVDSFLIRVSKLQAFI